jgi:glucuronate isomerase
VAALGADLSRRIDVGVLANLVAEHRLEEDEATDTAVDLVTSLLTRVFKL